MRKKRHFHLCFWFISAWHPVPVVSIQQCCSFTLAKVVHSRNSLLQVSCVPPNAYAIVLAPRTSEYDPIWRWGLTEVFRLTRGWALIQYDWCAYKKRKFGHKNIYKGKTMWRDTRRPSISKDRGLEQSLPSQSFQKEPIQSTAWFWTSSLQNVRQYISVKLPSLWCFAMASPASNIQLSPVWSFANLQSQHGVPAEIPALLAGPASSEVWVPVHWDSRPNP